MEILFILGLVVIPFGIGLILFIYLHRKEALMPWQLYTILRGLVFAFFLMPTFFVAGHGGIPTNTIAGFITALVFGGADVGFRGLAFGKAGGPGVYLESCILGLIIYAVIFVIDVFIHNKRFN